MRVLISATALVAAMAGNAHAADNFQVPQGCEAFLTTQMRDCTAALAWRCSIAPEGDYWIAGFDAEGLTSIVAYDRQSAWLDAVYMWDSSREETLPGAADPISLDDLLATGADSFEFQVRRADEKGTRTLTVVGEDVLTGNEAEFDGVTMLEVHSDFKFLESDGSINYHQRGTQYIWRDARMFFLGPDEVLEGDQSYAYDSSPVALIRPGEPGFAETTPLYGCGADVTETSGGDINATGKGKKD